jgi:hypothetical protein
MKDTLIEAETEWMMPLSRMGLSGLGCLRGKRSTKERVVLSC